MPLTKEKTEEIIKKINEAISRTRGTADFECPICKYNQFSLAGGFTNDFLLDKLGRGLIIGGPVLPSVPIVCTNCGNTFFLNAKVLGIELDEDKDNQEKSGEKKEGISNKKRKGGKSEE